DTREERAPLLLLSGRGEVHSDGADSTLEMTLDGGELHRVTGQDAYTRAEFAGATLAVGISDFFRRRNKFNRPANELSIGEMPEAAADARERGDDRNARRIETAYHVRHASILSCLVFGLVGVPLAASGRRGRGGSFVATFLAFAGYY